jgi:hypothetical protein
MTIEGSDIPHCNNDNYQTEDNPVRRFSHLRHLLNHCAFPSSIEPISWIDEYSLTFNIKKQSTVLNVQRHLNEGYGRN